MIFKYNKEKVLFGIVCALLFNVIVDIFVFQKYVFHSDDAMFVFYAEEIAKHLSFFPKGYHYTTEIFGLCPSYIMFPFTFFISNKILLHEIGSSLFLIITVIFLEVAFREYPEEGKLCIILFLIPVSWTYNDMFFYQAAYTSQLIWIALFIMVSKRYVIAESVTSPKNITLSYLNMLMYLIAINLCGLRSLFYIIAPAIISILIWYYEENMCQLKKLIKDVLFWQRIIAFLIMLIVSILIYKINATRLGFTANNYNGSFLGAQEIWNNIGAVLNQSLSLYGYSATSTLFDGSAIRNIAVLILYSSSFIVAPIYWLINYKHVEDSRKKFIIIFAFCSQLVQNLYFLLTGAYIDRYFLSIMVMDYILLGFMITNLSNKYQWEEILVIGGVIVTYIVTGLLSSRYQLAEAISEKKIFNPKAETTISSYLEEKNLNYGFAKFWTAYPISFSTNGKVEIAAFDQNDPLLPYYFDSNSYDNMNYYGCSEDLYNPDLHQGRCFILLKDGEIIDEKYYNAASDLVKIDNYRILIFDQNIHNIFSNKEQSINMDDKFYLPLDREYVFDACIQNYSDTSFYENGNVICLMPGASLNVNTVDLRAGKYLLGADSINTNMYEISLSNLIQDVSDLDSSVKNNNNEADAKTHLGLLDIGKDAKGYQINIKNIGDSLLKISNLKMEYVKEK